MSFFEGLHADLTERGRGERRPILVRLFLALLERFDRLRQRFGGGR